MCRRSVPSDDDDDDLDLCDVPEAAGADGGGPSEPFDPLTLGVAQRAAAPPLFRAAETTKEWVEHGWHGRSAQAAEPSLIPAARIWHDLACHAELDGTPFLSPHLADAACCLPGAVAALAFLSLPFAHAAPHAVGAAGAGVTVTTSGHALAACVEIAPVDGPPSEQVLLGQSYFQADDRWAYEGSERVDKPVLGEMVRGVVYTCRVVVNNPTSRRQLVAILHQIPVGAIAVGGGVGTCTERRGLEPYESAALEFSFYWPQPGAYAHYGAQVTRAAGGPHALLAAVAPRTLVVASAPSDVDADSWTVTAQRGSLDAVCAFLAARNLGRVELGAIAWRCRERGAFERITAVLAERRVVDTTLWAYALVHADAPRAREWLAALGGAGLGDVGPAFACALVEFEPAEHGAYEHLEYGPLINARAHRLGEQRRIANEALGAQWRSFLLQLAHRPAPRAEDELAASHYLFAMDRPDEAIARLARVDASRLETRGSLQLRYMRAYAAVLTGELPVARAHLAGLADHPVERWRARFAALKALLDEASGGPPAAVTDADSRDQAMAAAARHSPTVSVSVDARAGAVVIAHSAQLEHAELRFYRVDLELLFSRQPFFGADSSRFAFIAPTQAERVPLGAQSPTSWPLPAELRRHSVVIEAVAGSARDVCTHFAHELLLSVVASHGQLRVSHAPSGAARIAAYVKCYARYHDGGVHFYKDGYTDLCGRFDYATLSTDDLDRVERFALLVVDDSAGSTVVEAAPPAR